MNTKGIMQEKVFAWLDENNISLANGMTEKERKAIAAYRAKVIKKAKTSLGYLALAKHRGSLGRGVGERMMNAIDSIKR